MEQKRMATPKQIKYIKELLRKGTPKSVSLASVFIRKGYNKMTYNDAIACLKVIFAGKKDKITQAPIVSKLENTQTKKINYNFL
ncbi:MAG: hypothetical protein RBR02_06300 [Desulfuromonadaceae bacterium]|nr:hypothetical protein [Desulfuromonadaceae bacterium]